MPKMIFVLDSNAILHDSSCIYQFEENNVVIPITVIEELDQFKKGNETLNIQARQFLRSLDAQSNGLSYLIEKMKGQKLYAHINLLKGERSGASELAINML
jgi:predicted ribonuclease YlaK